MTADAPADDPGIHAALALPAGTRFGELEILGTLGVGGFGIVYLARDHALEREVAIKEYMPSQFALRDGHAQVTVRAASMRDTFELGLRSFVNEARLLARFDHPSLLKVYRFWEANGTAYMAMPRLIGQNLRAARTTQPTPPPEAWVRRIFDAVLGGLEALHAQQVWHRDVAPDNIFLPADGGVPILLDFGAARQVIGDGTQAFTAILKPSFAPIEQYAEAAGLKQGPWTDFYALAAVTHELLTGQPPPPCTARAMADELAPLAVPGYAPAFLAALDWGLRVPPHQRPPSAAAWRAVADGRAPVPAARALPPRPAAPPPPEPVPSRLDIEFADTVQALPEDLLPDAAAVKPAAAVAAGRRQGWGLIAAAGVLAVVLLGLFVRQVRQQAAPQAPAADVAASAVTTASVAPPEAPSAPASGVAAAPVTAPEPAASVAVAPPAPAASRAASRPAPRREARLIATEKAGDYRPVSRSPAAAPPEPVAPAPAPVQAAAASAVAAEPRTPAEACGSRILLARAWCIDRQCEKPQFRNDAECVRLRELRELRNSHRDVP